MATTTEDWNPRSLSSFSTFGGSQGSPPLNGHANGAIHVNGNGVGSDNGTEVDVSVGNGGTGGMNHGSSGGNRGMSNGNGNNNKNGAGNNGNRVNKGVESNGANRRVNNKNGAGNNVGNRGMNNRNSDGVNGDGNSGMDNGINSDTNSISVHVTGKSNMVTVNGSTPPDILNSPDVIPSVFKMAAALNHNHSNQPQPSNTKPPELFSLNHHNLHNLKPHLGTPVAPPSIEGVVRVKHFHSRSLAGDELPSSALLPPPKHGHSRSLVENIDHLLPGHNKSPDGATVKEVCLFLGAGDRRFGFSVVGGVGEKYPPRIEEMAVGSPADKADLEVGDEILEVNGKSLEDATHTEVISHIHQCIRSRTICLRVKRRTGNKLAVDLAQSSNVQDAFVIAVEQQARERLERLSALKKIKPVDMTKLSTQLEPHRSVVNVGSSGQASPGLSPAIQEQDDVNGVLETAPIYVTSVPNLTSEQRARSRSRSSTPNRTSTSPRRQASTRSSRDTPPSPLTPSPRKEGASLKSGDSPGADRSSRRSSRRRGQVKIINGHLAEDQGNKSGDELELTHDLNDTLDDTEELDQDDLPDRTATDSDDRLDLEGACLSESGDSLPGTPEKAYGITRHESSRRSSSRRRKTREVLLDQEPLKTPVHAVSSVDSRDSTSSRKSGGSSGSGEVGRGTPRRKSGSTTPRHSRKGREQPTIISAPEIGQDNMISMVEFDPGHREMAVDVPESFVAKTKTPPRYPPPKPQGQTITPIHNNNNNSSKSSRRGGSSSGSVTPQNGTLPKQTPPPRIPNQQSPDLPPPPPPEGLMQHPSTQEEMNRIKKYEEELKQRREREEQEAMLRTSLRSSQKLQQLANKPIPSGVVNEGFAVEESQAAAEAKPSDDTPSKVIGINELIQSLQRIQTVLKSNGHRISEDMTLVAQLLTNPEFQKVLAVHNKVQETWCLNRPPTPVTDNAQELLAESLQELQEYSVPEAAELLDILNKYSLEGLLYAHDRIAEREPLPVGGGTLPEEAVLDRVTNYPEESVKIVRIDKTNEPLGATIRNEGDSVIIGRIVKRGAAEKSGLLHEGDEILEVNGVEVRGKSVNDICDMLAGMTGTLTFIIIPGVQQPPPPRPPVTQTIHVKAHFDYDPEEDLYIPCRELGMSFQKGDILHVISQSDPNWWQAYRDGEEDHSLAGLIPSRSFQQHREAMRQTVVGDNNNKEKTKKGKLLCAKKHQKKKKKKMLYSNYNEDFDSEEILTYEDVALYYPHANCKRPIVLIGPPNIGRHELRQKLMEDRERFAAAIPHTSRERRESELDGQDYHFISRAEFERGIMERKFVEHGEYEKAYYGTSISAIREVVKSGKICVLNLHPLSLKILKSSDLKPFVVFVAPPSLEKLRQKKQRLGEPIKDEELKETIEKAREMEEQYGHYFDLIIINQDVDRAYTQLLQDINMLEREPQWVPAAWLTHDQ